ncbi:hypothetical protein [Bdellovibrio bacteriovorus]|uniref:hypothetical protein n=1 Tax=Bdellovibrio TaxID=958 RepID=UPI0035A933C5
MKKMMVVVLMLTSTIANSAFAGTTQVGSSGNSTMSVAKDLCWSSDSGSVFLKMKVKLDTKKSELQILGFREVDPQTGKDLQTGKDMSIQLSKVRFATKADDESMYGTGKNNVLLFPKSGQTIEGAELDPSIPLMLVKVNREVALFGQGGIIGSTSLCKELK